MKKILFLCLNVLFVVSNFAARPILTKAKWEQMQQERTAYGEVITPETRPMLIDEPQDDGDENEADQTPPPLPPRPVNSKQAIPVVIEKSEMANKSDQSIKAVALPNPDTQQPMMTGVTKEQAAQGKSVPALTRPDLPFTDQDLTMQASKLTKVGPVKAAQKESVTTLKQQLEAKFKGASGAQQDESETEEWED